MLIALYIFLPLLALLYVLSAKRRNVLAHPVMYFIGTVVFLFPGALLGDAVLWHVKEDTAWRAYWLMLLSIAGVLAGCLPLAEPTALVRPADRVPLPFLSPRILQITLVVCIVVKLLLDPDTIVGRVVTRLERPEGAFEKYLFALGALPTAVACLAPWMWRNAHPLNWKAKVSIVSIVCVGLVSLSRTPIFYILGVNLLSWLYHPSERWRTPHWRLMAIFCAGAAVPAMIFLAAFVKGTNLMVESALEGWGVDISDAFRFALEWQYTLAVSDAYGNFLFILDNYPGEYGFIPGLSLAIIATAFVPREWIAWKPMSVSYYVTAQVLGEGVFEKAGTSLATSFVGELWLNEGTAAVIVGSLLLGRLGRLIRRTTIQYPDTDFHHTIYIMSLVMFVLIPRGDIMSTLVRGMVYIFLAYLSARVLMFFSKARVFGHTPMRCR